MIRPETRDIVLVIYGFGGRPALEAAMQFSEQQLELFCAAGDVSTRLV